MIRLIWNVSVLIHGVLRYAPTNRLAAATRMPRGLKWGWAATLLAPVYFIAADVVLKSIEQGAPQWLSLVSAILLWNGMKMLWIGPTSLVLLARNGVRHRIQPTHAPRARQRTGGSATQNQEMLRQSGASSQT